MRNFKQNLKTKHISLISLPFFLSLFLSLSFSLQSDFHEGDFWMNIFVVIWEAKEKENKSNKNDLFVIYFKSAFVQIRIVRVFVFSYVLTHLNLAMHYVIFKETIFPFSNPFISLLLITYFDLEFHQFINACFTFHLLLPHLCKCLACVISQ